MIEAAVNRLIKWLRYQLPIEIDYINTYFTDKDVITYGKAITIPTPRDKGDTDNAYYFGGNPVIPDYPAIFVIPLSYGMDDGQYNIGTGQPMEMRYKIIINVVMRDIVDKYNYLDIRLSRLTDCVLRSIMQNPFLKDIDDDNAFINKSQIAYACMLNGDVELYPTVQDVQNRSSFLKWSEMNLEFLVMQQEYWDFSPQED